MGVGRAIRFGVAAAVAAAFLTLSPAAFGAGATVVTSPTSHDFGSQQVATASAPFTFTLTNRCFEDIANPGTCIASHPFTPSVSVTGDFAIQNNNCTAPMAGDTVFGTSCTFDVVFLPTIAGSRSGAVDVGDPAGFGKAAVTGTGIVPPLPTTTTTPGALPGTVPTAKKCKKRHRSAAAAAKRCRKRR